MADLFENPMGLDGFEFVEFASPIPGVMEPVFKIPTGPMELRLPAIKGIGGAPLYLIDHYEQGQSFYDIDFNFFEGVGRHPKDCGFKLIDHLTHNVYRGRMNESFCRRRAPAAILSSQQSTKEQQ